MSRLLCAVVIVLAASVVHAQTITQHDDQTITVRAEGVPVATLLSHIVRVYPIERVTIQPGLEPHLVSIVLERVAPAAAVVAILKASGLDFAIAGRRIVVGDWTATGEAAAAPLLPMEMRHESSVGDETTILPASPVPYIANGENITYLEANFVPYKMRPHVRALRMAIDVATIP